MWLVQIIRIISIYTDWTISVVLDFLFQLLNNIAFVQLKSNIVTTFANRVYVFLGVIMLFKLAFSFINYIINPDSVEDKTKGAAATFKNIFICLILIFTVPIIFKTAFTIQNEILNKNLIPRLILGMDDTNEDENNFMKQGREMTFSVYSALITPNEVFFDENGPLNNSTIGGEKVVDVCSDFYKIDQNRFPTNAAKCMSALFKYKVEKDGKPTTFVGQFFNTITFGTWSGMKSLASAMEINSHMLDRVSFLTGVQEHRSIPLLNMYILSASTNLEQGDNPSDSKEFLFNYMAITPLITLFIAYTVIIFCFDVAVRVIKLGFLQIIAPVPIISYIDPKSSQSGMFKKWVSTCFKTYIDLFIRIAIIYFALFIISQINSGGFERADGGYIDPFVKIFLILGILKFAKDLPKLLQDITGIDLKGDFTLNLGKKVGDIPGVGRLAQKGIAGGMAMFGKDMKGANPKERITHAASVARKNNDIGWMGDKNKSIFSNTEFKRIKEDRLKIKNESAEATKERLVNQRKWDMGKGSLNKVGTLDEKAEPADYNNAGFKYNKAITADHNLQVAKKKYKDKAEEIEVLRGEQFHENDPIKRKQIGQKMAEENDKLKGLDKAVTQREKDLDAVLKDTGAQDDKELFEARKLAKGPRPGDTSTWTQYNEPTDITNTERTDDDRLIELSNRNSQIDAEIMDTFSNNRVNHTKANDDRIINLGIEKMKNETEVKDILDTDLANKKAEEYFESQKVVSEGNNTSTRNNEQKQPSVEEDTKNKPNDNQSSTNANKNSKRLNEIATELNGLNSLIADKNGDLISYNEKAKEFETDKYSASYRYWNNLIISTEQSIAQLEAKREQLFNEIKELKGE